MVWPRFQPRQTEPVQQLAHGQLAHATLMHLDLEPLRDDTAQVTAAPTHHAVPGRIRPGQRDHLEFRHLLRGQCGRAAGGRQVRQTRNPVLVIAVHPIAQCLPVHAARLRRRSARGPVQHQCNRQHAAGCPGVTTARRLASSCRLVRDLGAIVEVATLPMLDMGQDRALRRATAAVLIGHDHPGPILQTPAQLLEEPLGRVRVAPALHQDVEPRPVLPVSS